MVGVRSRTPLSYVFFLLKRWCGPTSLVPRDTAKSLLPILGLSQCLNDRGLPGEGSGEPRAERMGTLLRTDSERRWQPHLYEPIFLELNATSPTFLTTSWLIFSHLSLFKPTEGLLFIYLFIYFLKLGREEGGLCL